MTDSFQINFYEFLARMLVTSYMHQRNNKYLHDLSYIRYIESFVDIYKKLNIDDKGEIADVDLLQRTANTLPDRDNSILLMNALMLDDNAELMVKVAAKLSKSLLGITLLRGSWLRHKTETYKKLESLDTTDMETAIQALLAVSKYLSLAELRDIVNWTEDEKHIFLQLFNT